MADNLGMKAAPDGRLRSAASRRIAVPPARRPVERRRASSLTTHAVDADRHAAADRQARTDAEQIRGLLERAGTFDVGARERPGGRARAQPLAASTALVGSATTTRRASADAMWVESVTARGRRGIRSPHRGADHAAARQAAGAAGLRATCRRRSSPACPFPPGVDVSGLPALAATLRNPASIFAGTATAEQSVERAARLLPGPGRAVRPRSGQPGLPRHLRARGLAEPVPERESTHHRHQPRRSPLSRAWLARHPEPARASRRSRSNGGVAVAQEPESALQAIVAAARAGVAAGDSPARLPDRSRDAAAPPRRTRGGRHLRPLAGPAVHRRCRRLPEAREPGVRAHARLRRSRIAGAARWWNSSIPDDREATTAVDRQAAGGAVRPSLSRAASSGRTARFAGCNGTRDRCLSEQLMYAAAHDVTDTRMLLDEQAALRRVATLVAQGPEAERAVHGRGGRSRPAAGRRRDASAALRRRTAPPRWSPATAPRTRNSASERALDLEGTHVWGRVARRARPASRRHVGLARGDGWRRSASRPRSQRRSSSPVVHGE